MALGGIKARFCCTPQRNTEPRLCKGCHLDLAAEDKLQGAGFPRGCVRCTRNQSFGLRPWDLAWEGRPGPGEAPGPHAPAWPRCPQPCSML